MSNQQTQEQSGLTPIEAIFATLNLPEVSEKLKAEKQARLEEIGDRIREKYGSFITDNDVLKIADTEQELRECENCKGYPCHKAHNRGYLPIIVVGNGYVSTNFTPCKLRVNYARQRELERNFKNAKIPAIYLGKTLADYNADKDNKHAIAFAKDVLSKGLSGAYFYGEVGAGKTFLAAIIAQEFLQAGKSVLFESVSNLLSEFYEIYRGKSDKSEEDLLKALYTTELLVLDDFGMEKPTQFVGTTLSKILDARYNRRDVTTLITSNYSLEQVKARLNAPTDAKADDLCLNGSRIYDRCIEICKPIKLKGESRRR